MATPVPAQIPPQSAIGSPNPLASEAQTGAQIAGGNGAWRKLLVQAESLATHLGVAVIEGEQGSGKRTLARYLHSRSPLFRLPFEPRDAREWISTSANLAPLAGFIYLDRVDLLSVTERERLLEILKAVQDFPLGRVALVASSRTPFRQSSNERMVLRDMTLRLTAIRFAVPPLRQRREDIAPLAQLLLDQLSARHQQQRAVLGSGALARLLQHNWPGNVRELASALEAAMIGTTNGVIHGDNLQLSSSNEACTEPKTVVLPMSALDLHSVIRNHVRYVLDLNRGNKLRSSRQLGISRSTLYRILGNESVLGR